MYELTREGMECLHDWVESLMVTYEFLGVFRCRYSEFVAV
jgi:hypothetical protein